MKQIVIHQLILTAILIGAVALCGCRSIQAGAVFEGVPVTRNTVVVSPDNMVRAGETPRMSGMGLTGDMVDDVFDVLPDPNVFE